MGTSKNQVVKLRENLGFTQESFAKEIGYSRSYVKDIESGRSQPSRRFLEAIAKTFGVSLDSMMSNLINTIVDALEWRFSIHDYEAFVFLYAFTKEGLIDAENELTKSLKKQNHLVVDAKGVPSTYNLYCKIIGRRVSVHNIYEELNKFLLEKRRYIVLKNLSSSRIKEKGFGLRDLARETSGLSDLIVIDKPSFLEKYANELYDRAITIRFNSWMIT